MQFHCYVVTTRVYNKNLKIRINCKKYFHKIVTKNTENMRF